MDEQIETAGEADRNVQKKKDFIKYLYAYIAVNPILWIVWWFMEGRFSGFTIDAWPVWIMVGWGMGIALKYFDAYHGKGDQ